MEINKHDNELYLYKLYNKELMKDTNLDWFQVEHIYKNFGNTPGIYPDTLYLILNIINNYNIKRIVELGSGVSTLYFSKICENKGIQFTSYEEKEEWRNITHKLLNYYNLNTKIENFTSLNDCNLNYNLDCDLIFIDCSDEMRIKLLESNKLNNIPIIMVDDSERKSLSVPYSKFISNSKRYGFYTYNGVGRIDRHLVINTIYSIDIDNMVKRLKL